MWRLWKNPQLKIMVVSANETHAAKVATFIHFLIHAEDAETREPAPWSELRPRRGQRSSTLSFDVGPAMPDKDPSVFAVGITGQLAGGRADIILSDDVEVPGNSATETQREQLTDRIGEYAAILKPDGEVIFLGTWQTQQSVYRGLRDKGYDIRIWPARYPLADKLPAYGGGLAPMIQADLEADPALMKPQGSSLGGAPTDPARFTDVDLLERETDWRAAGFVLQFMLDTSLSDAERFPLKLRDLVMFDVPKEMAPVNLIWASSPEQTIKDPLLPNVGFDGDRFFRPMYVSPEFTPYTGTVMHIDPSGKGRDETSFVVTKFLSGFVWVRRWGGFTDGFGEATLLALAEIAKEEKVNLVVEETNYGGGMFGKLLEPVLRKVGHAVPVEGIRSVGQKERRIIDTLHPLLKQHRLVMDITVARSDLASKDTVRSGLYQLTHMTSARGALKHDDRVDVLAQAIAHWTPFLNTDAAASEEKIKENHQKEWDRLFFGNAGQAYRASPHGRRGQGRRIGGRARR